MMWLRDLLGFRKPELVIKDRVDLARARYLDAERRGVDDETALKWLEHQLDVELGIMPSPLDMHDPWSQETFTQIVIRNIAARSGP